MQSGEQIAIDGRSYRLGAILSPGTGSYGQVWAATDETGRNVALKFAEGEKDKRTEESEGEFPEFQFHRHAGWGRQH